jgi:uncharacterized coiled-coil protein SlyX
MSELQFALSLGERLKELELRQATIDRRLNDLINALNQTEQQNNGDISGNKQSDTKQTSR